MTSSSSGLTLTLLFLPLGGYVQKWSVQCNLAGLVIKNWLTLQSAKTDFNPSKALIFTRLVSVATFPIQTSNEVNFHSMEIYHFHYFLKNNLYWCFQLVENLTPISCYLQLQTMRCIFSLPWQTVVSSLYFFLIVSEAEAERGDYTHLWFIPEQYCSSPEGEWWNDGCLSVAN